MGRVLTNNFSLQYALEDTELDGDNIGLLAGETGADGFPINGTPDWFLLEPNDIGTFGAEITNTERDPISKSRQRCKGTTTDLDSSTEFEADWTLSHFRDFIEGFVFATSVNGEMDLDVASVDTTLDEYTVNDLTAAQLAKLDFAATDFAPLIYGRGFTSSGNNGLKELDVDPTAAVAATSLLTFTGQPSNGDTVTIDSKVYTYQTTLTNIDGNVLIGASAALSRDNLVDAINLGAGAGTDYALATKLHRTVSAAANAANMDATAKTPGTSGNSIVTADTGTLLAWTGGTLAGGTAATIAVVEDLTTEASPPANAQIELAGVRFLAANTDVAYSVSGSVATVTVSGLVGFDWSTWVVPGMFLHWGSLTDAGVVQNAFQNVAVNDQFGFGRVLTVSALTITMDKLSPAMAFTPSVTPTVVDVMIGKFTRNVDVDSAEFLERSFQFEGSYPNLGSASTTEFEYSKGNFCDTVSFELGLADKATMSLGFIGTDTDSPTTVRKTNAASAEEPNMTGALNTSSDIVRLRITDVDETGLTTDFKSFTLTFGNEVSPEKVLGRLGAKFMNTGNLLVDIEADLLFTNGDVVDRIRDNVTLTMDFGVTGDDGTVIFDVPSLTLGDGSKSFPVNESVQISVEVKAFRDDILGTSIGVTQFSTELPVE